MALAFIRTEELRSRLKAGHDMVILDIRQPADYDSSSLKIRGARHVSPADIYAFSAQLPKNKEIIIYGRYTGEETGQRVAQFLRSQGFEKVYPLDAGFQDWLNAGLEMEPK